MLYDRIYKAVGNEEQTAAIMDIIRPLQRTRTMALERLASICCRGDECTVGTHIGCPFSNRECYEITAKDWAFYLCIVAEREQQDNASK